MRPAGHGDATTLAALHGACFAEAWSVADFAALLALPGASALIAEGGGEAVGFVLVRAVGGECEILSMGVRPADRRRGLGARLLDRALAEAARAGAGVVFLEVAIDNIAALALYRRAGFREVGRRSRYYRPTGTGRPAADALVLRLDL
ncbi:MAG: ribosomal protein S18-alanine N-acetyltransferase [Proteobacteria bacterium]|nr:ribosomal protein S18-alanine N-acetyltransferase [Pseudomonadota bacterium]